MFGCSPSCVSNPFGTSSTTPLMIEFFGARESAELRRQLRTGREA
jgi:hypothetical protein